MKKKCLWISDFKVSDHIGGAELVNDILIGYCPEDIEIKHIHIHEYSSYLHNSYKPDFAIVDSITRIDSETRLNDLYHLFQNVPFFSLEHDYNKVSRHRHLFHPNDTFLKSDDYWSSFYKSFWANRNRKMTFLMSHGQRNIQLEKIKEAIMPDDFEYVEQSTTVMSSCIYSKETLNFIDKINKRNRKKEDYYLIFKTGNPLKGTSQSVAYAEDNGLKYKFFERMTPKQLLVAFSKAKGLVFMPTMHDVCPRITVESLLFGGDVHTNEYAQHSNEEWFINGKGRCREYVEERPKFFWDTIKNNIQDNMNKNINKNMKIVCVGAAKTGTTTCGNILKKLGYSHLSFNKKYFTRNLSEKSLEEVKLLIDKNESFDDWPWKFQYQYINNRYTDSKFILTKRKDHLVTSISSWYHNNSHNTIPNEKFLKNRIEELQDWDSEIESFFKDQPNKLLIINFSDNHDNILNDISKFLKIEIPDGFKIPKSNANNNYPRDEIYKMFSHLVN